MALAAPPTYPVTHLDMLSFVGLERSHLRGAVYRRVFGDDVGPVRIGRYSILERVGAGARGVVFKAFDNQLDRLVALKVLSARADDHDELLREAKALARLSHPNVLPVYEVGETDEDQVFLATEYVKGWTLRGWYDEETRGETAIVEVMRQVARGVQAAHAEGLVHRDLKPANILLGEDGRVRVADFGLARFDPTALEPTLGIPRDGLATTTAGTPGYMAPELFRGAPASAASDQYALAVTLHELLCGSLPDESDGLRGVSKPVSTALRRGLAEAPEDRFGSVGAFAEALVTATRSPMRRRMPWVAGLCAVAGAGTAIFMATPMDERAADNDLALLRARAALPEDPAAALDELRNAPDLSDARLLPTAERALAMGPEKARYTLPEGTHDITLVGSILLFRDARKELGVRRLDLDGLHMLDAATLGFSERSRDQAFLLHGEFAAQIVLDDPLALASVDPRAARRFVDRKGRSAISQDGRRVARTTDDGRELSVEDATTGETVWSLVTDEVIDNITLDATGNRVAWSERPGAARIYDLSSDEIFEIEPAASTVLFEDGETSVIVRGMHTGVFRTDLATMETIRLFASDERFRQVEVSPGGAWVAAQGQNDTITVTNLAVSVPREITGSRFEFSPDGSLLAVLDGPTIEVYDLESGDMHAFPSPGGVESFDFSTPRTLWVAGRDGIVRRFDVPATMSLLGHTGSALDLALSNDGNVAFSIAGDFTLRRWNVETGAGQILAELDSDPRRLALHEHENRVAVGISKGPTLTFDMDTGAPLADAPRTGVRPVVGPDNALYGANEDGVWRNLDGETSMLATDVHECTSLAATAQWVAAVCDTENSRLHLWEGESHTSVSVTDRGFGGSLHAWPDGDHIYYIGKQEHLLRRTGEGSLDRLESPRLLGELDPFSLPASSNAAHDLIVRKPGGLYALWDPTELPVALFETDGAATIAVSGDGRRVAYSTRRNDIIVRDRALSKATPDLSVALRESTTKEGER